MRAEATLIGEVGLSGELRWVSGVLGEVLAAPAVSATSVAVRSVDGRLRVLDIDDGVERWNVEQPVPRLTLRGTSAPAISGRRLPWTKKGT